MASLIGVGGRYYLDFCDSARSPRRKRVALKVRYRRDAERIQRLLEARWADGSYDPWVDPDWHGARADPALATLGEAYDAFMEAKSACRPATRDHYRWTVGRFVDHMGRSHACTSLTWRDVHAWLAGVGRCAQSRKTYLERIGIFLRWLVERGILSADVSRQVPCERPPDKLAGKLVTPAQLSRIVEIARASTTPYIADVAVVAFDLALRLGEVCAMRCDWVDLGRRTVYIRCDGAFQTKTGKERSTAIGDRALAVLRRVIGDRAGGGDFVFRNARGRRLTSKHTSKRFKRLVRAAGLPEAVTFHGLRHGGISRLIVGGASVEAVRRFAGHTRVEMTMRYTHLLDDQYDEQVLKALRQ